MERGKIKNKTKKEIDILHEYLTKKKLKTTKQRQIILEMFLSIEGHISAEDLYGHINKKDPSIGLATVYRAMNLFLKCGLAQKRQFGKNHIKYEHTFNHSHHDHLICNFCGEIVEFKNNLIEKLQADVAHENSFTVHSHTLELYGICGKCSCKNRLKNDEI